MGDSCTGSPLDPVRAIESGTHDEPGASDKMTGFAHGLRCDAPQLEMGQESQSDLRMRDRARQPAQRLGQKGPTPAIPVVRTSTPQSRIVARPGQPGSSMDAVVVEADSSKSQPDLRIRDRARQLAQPGANRVKGRLQYASDRFLGVGKDSSKLTDRWSYLLTNPFAGIRIGQAKKPGPVARQAMDDSEASDGPESEDTDDEEWQGPHITVPAAPAEYDLPSGGFADPPDVSYRRTLYSFLIFFAQKTNK